MRSMFIVAPLVLAACGGNGNNGGDDDAVDAPSAIDAPPTPPGFTRLIGRTWSIPSGQLDTYRCVRLTIPEDTYITNIQAQAPLGTHHTVLSIASGGAAGPDGEQNCSAGTLGMVMLYASGVGTSPLDFPTGVGIRVAAGTQLHLNLHLFNATDNTLEGETVILVKSQPTPPATLAEMVFGGTFQIALQGNNPNPVTLTGRCTANAPYTLFAVWPHMHQLATHSKIELVRNGTRTVLHDQPYTFSEQNYYLQTPEVSVQAGDRIDVACTYVNNTPNLVTFGESSNQEMCFGGLYRYPAANNGLFCVN